jgi:hypothetical protein
MSENRDEMKLEVVCYAGMKGDYVAYALDYSTISFSRVAGRGSRFHVDSTP